MASRRIIASFVRPGIDHAWYQGVVVGQNSLSVDHTPLNMGWSSEAQSPGLPQVLGRVDELKGTIVGNGRCVLDVLYRLCRLLAGGRLSSLLRAILQEVRALTGSWGGAIFSSSKITGTPACFREGQDGQKDGSLRRGSWMACCSV